MKKHSLLHTLPLCFLLLFGGCTAKDQPLTNDHSGIVSEIPTPTPTFEEFAHSIFVEEITADTISLRYTLSRPENYGIADYPITLGSVKDAVSPDEEALTIYEQLLTYNEASLSEEERLTYHALKHHLDLSLTDEFSPYLLSCSVPPPAIRRSFLLCWQSIGLKIKTM